jgi:hypothetical protein
MSTYILLQDSRLQGCDTVMVAAQFQMFQRNVLPSPSSVKKTNMTADTEHCSTTSPLNIRTTHPAAQHYVPSNTAVRITDLANTLFVSTLLTCAVSGELWV